GVRPPCLVSGTPIEFFCAQVMVHGVQVALLPHCRCAQKQVYLGLAGVDAELREQFEGMPAVTIHGIELPALQVGALHPTMGDGLCFPIFTLAAV
ncbi:MAG TPA: hypothetical protein VFB84_17070, partial [Micromonosporaceae bacterium]|nr:hypothetical protein [Micromonosporaceae bacterium]